MRRSDQIFRRRVTQTVSLRYRLALPQGYAKRPQKKWPLVLFLHGAGERGADLRLVSKHGPPKLVEQGREFPFILVSPQCPVDAWWRPEELAVLLDEIEEKYRVDTRRIYVTGLSMGGFGTWALAVTYPRRFAAIVPICGGGFSWIVARIQHLPVWVFHGKKDTIVELRQSEEMVNALKQCGSQVKFTVYPDAGHDSWTATYANPQLYRWLLKQKRPVSQS